MEEEFDEKVGKLALLGQGKFILYIKDVKDGALNGVVGGGGRGGGVLGRHRGTIR